MKSQPQYPIEPSQVDLTLIKEGDNITVVLNTGYGNELNFHFRFGTDATFTERFDESYLKRLLNTTSGFQSSTAHDSCKYIK